MGNECTSCFNKAGDNKIEDLSYKNPIINKIIQEQNENQNQDLSYINMEIKENERFIENNDNDNNKINLLKNQIKEIPPEYIIKLNKYIRGHLLRLLYKNKLKLQLENFALHWDLVSSFEEENNDIINKINKTLSFLIEFILYFY